VEVRRMKVAFPKLFETGQIGNLELKNRIVKAPQHTGLAARDGSVTERLIRYYKEIALGGTGLIIVEYAWIDYDASRAAPCQLGVADMDHIAGLSLLTRTIHTAGAKIALQISHAGRQKFLCCPPIKAPSRVPWEELYYYEHCPPPQELTFEEIQQIIKAFGDAAVRAQTADFDMVEVHAAHGYLIAQFLSPRTNKRADWYGGSLENRMRFLVEVTAEVRSRVGPTFPLSVRLSGTDYEPDGYNIEESIQVAKKLEELGVSVLNISGGNHHQTLHEVSPMIIPLAHNVWAAEAIKNEVKIPVITCGSITTPGLAEEILQKGKADFIGLGRPLFADPQWPQKAKEGRAEDIRTCIRCNDGCLSRSDALGKSILCSVNSSLGDEEESRIVPAIIRKNIAIVGGGVAGMEAAMVCSLRGHKVTLFEKRKLGGSVNEASVPEFKADLRPLIKYFVTQMENLKVNVVNKQATVSTIKQGGYDAVIVATGASPFIPDVQGIDNPIVSESLDILSGNKKVGKKVIIVGGVIVGVEVGLLLAEQGKEIIFVEMLDDFMNGLLPDEKMGYMERLAKQKFSVKTGKRLELVKDKGAVIIDRFGKREEILADSIVIAAGFSPNRDLIDQLKRQTSLEVYEAGDCIKPRKIFDAIHDGNRVARQL
jgi:2,4-dienoyl-CoA reductase-like NADH-dependent reductase (Old Yellow Enzyme family)/thioredoxin reductase